MGSGTSRLFRKSPAMKRGQSDIEADRLQKMLIEKEEELQKANRALQDLQFRSQPDEEKERLQSLLAQREAELRLAHQKLAEYQAHPASTAKVQVTKDSLPKEEISWSPFKPTRINHQNDRTSIPRLIIHHDGENCYVPNDDLLTFGPVRVALARLALSSSTNTSYNPESERIVLDRMEYFFYLTCWKKSFRFHPSQGYWNDMDTLGVHLEGVGTKKGSVDMKMKALLNRLAQTPADGAVVMVISGDRDFASELSALRHAGYYTVLLHCDNISRTRVVEESCDVAFACWFDILAQAHPAGVITLPAACLPPATLDSDAASPPRHRPARSPDHPGSAHPPPDDAAPAARPPKARRRRTSPQRRDPGCGAPAGPGVSGELEAEVKGWLRGVLARAGPAGVDASNLVDLWARQMGPGRGPLPLQALGFGRRRAVRALVAAWPDVVLPCRHGSVCILHAPPAPAGGDGGGGGSRSRAGSCDSRGGGGTDGPARPAGAAGPAGAAEVGGKVSRVVEVPADRVSLVVGSRQSTRLALERETGAAISVPHRRTGPGAAAEAVRIAVSAPTPAQADEACRRIRDIAAA